MALFLMQDRSKGLSFFLLKRQKENGPACAKIKLKLEVTQKFRFFSDAYEVIQAVKGNVDWSINSVIF